MPPSPLALPPRFALVTGNAAKVVEARRLAGGRAVELEHVALDLPELQSLDLIEVLVAKGEEAWRRLRRPLVVEETGLELAVWNGFPGPLVKWMLEAVGAEGIARAALSAGDARATARCALLYRDAERSFRVTGETSGELVAPARGTNGFGWDPVFVPTGYPHTYGELPAAEKDRIGHRGRAWRELFAAY